jgi:hypothetical protein
MSWPCLRISGISKKEEKKKKAIKSDEQGPSQGVIATPRHCRGSMAADSEAKSGGKIQKYHLEMTRTGSMVIERPTVLQIMQIGGQRRKI